MKEIHVGTYLLDGYWCEVWLDPNTDFSECRWPHRKPLRENAVMTLGVEGRNDTGMLSCMLHEALEYCLTNMGCRFIRTGPWIHDLERNDHVTFPITHTQFSMAIDRASDFLNDAFPDAQKKLERMRKKR